MGDWYLIIRYESIEAYEQHGEDISTKVKEVFEPCGASDFQPTVSTRTLPPTEFAGFTTNDDVNKDILEDAARKGFPEGVVWELQPK